MNEDVQFHVRTTVYKLPRIRSSYAVNDGSDHSIWVFSLSGREPIDAQASD